MTMASVQNQAAHPKRPALGRGLDSLLGGAPVAAEPAAKIATIVASAETLGDTVQEIALDLIERNPYQTRRSIEEQALDELASSISANGIIQAIVVRPMANGRYQLIAGERRWLACGRAGKQSVPAVVKQVSNEQALEMTIVENLQREDLNPMEHARAFDRLGREFSLTQEEISRRAGKDRATIANYLRLLRLPEEVQQLVEASRLTFGHAKVLLALDSPETMLRVAHKVAEDGLSVRATEALVAGLNAFPEEKAEAAKPAVDPNVRAAQVELERALGVKVEVRDRRGRGKIVIHYASLEDFDRVVEALGKKQKSAIS